MWSRIIYVCFWPNCTLAGIDQKQSSRNYTNIMNQKQRILLASWSFVLALLLAGIIFYEWVISNWSWLFIVLLAPSLLIRGLLGDEAYGYGRSGITLGDYIKKYPGFQLWIAIWLLCTAFILYYFGTQEQRIDEYGGLILLLFFVPLFGPIIVVSEYQRFKRLGESDNRA